MSAVLSATLSRKQARKPVPQTTITPEQAVVELAPKFRRAARRLWPSGERSLRADLVQEMSLACLMIRTPMPASHFYTRAVNHAINWLMHERRHDRLQLMPHNDVCEIIEAGQRINE